MATTLIPYRLKTDPEADLIIMGWFRGTTKKDKTPHYDTRIGFNPLSKEIIPEKTFCECWSFSTHRKKDPEFLCKHLIELKKQSIDQEDIELE